MVGHRWGSGTIRFGIRQVDNCQIFTSSEAIMKLKFRLLVLHEPFDIHSDEGPALEMSASSSLHSENFINLLDAKVCSKTWCIICLAHSQLAVP